MHTHFTKCKVLIAVFIFCTLYLCLSCTSSKHQAYNYFINIREIDCNTQTDVGSIKNEYISSGNELFEYKFRIKSTTTIDENGQTQSNLIEDSVAILYMPENRLIYYVYDLTGGLISTDSVKRKTKEFIKVSPENNSTDPIYTQMSIIKVEDLPDTAFNGMSYKVYTQPDIVKDSLGETAVQLFFLKNSTLKTPFNINERYPNLFNQYCFAGVSYHLLQANRKMVTVISDIKPATDQQKRLCDLIHKNLPNNYRP